MASIKRGAVLASTLMLIAIIATACNQPYSQQPSVTNTPIDPNSLFATPIGQTPSMGDVETFGTGTALALSGTPAGIATQTEGLPLIIGTQDLSVTVTPTPLVSVNATSTLAIGGTAIPGATSGPLPTSLPVGVRPAEYTLKPGEFPFCIARRFDVDPAELLRINGISSGEIFYANRTLRIPQSGSFPGTRALQPHTTYTVKPGETIYSIACKFGDVDPAVIIQANNLTSTTVTSGQTLTIP
ncbi:MAG: LysM peptidoglycan-binding domain-containing protein [Anaerolineales bacterium]